MTGKPAVTFMIPAHDRPRELKAALDSCLDQSCADWEAVVVDDHSDTADLQGLVAGFNDERMRYTRLEPGEHGVSMARNRAVALARTDRLITLDSDDLNHPDRAARCRALLDPAQPQLIYTRVRLFNDRRPEGWTKPVL